ncbi:hypothetical protein ABT354_27480 [Streptomyces sp. NPDC000594]|uniref:hypothetical protein n=1 Tax=Streptomyces sp. NPDC000594 TaxID=3154261 RepID=UPI00332D4573
MGHTGTTRRGVLAVTGAVAAGVLTGCADGPAGGAGQSRERERAERRLRGETAAASAALRERYEATIAVHPGLGGRLGALRDAVAAHATVLAPVRAGADRHSPSDAPSQAPSPGGPGAPAGAATARAAARAAVPTDGKAALRALARAERRTADARTAALLTAEPELARLLASLAAAGAAHAYLLTAPTRGDRR